MAMSKESVQGSDEVDEMYCELCKTKGRSQPAEGFCVDCCYYLCSKCLGYHTFFFPKHEQKDKVSMPQDVCLKPCADHVDEILKFYCRSCKQFFCFRCKEKNHKQCCNVSHLPTFVQTLKLEKKTRATCKALEKTLDNVIKRERMVDENIKSVDVLATKTKSEIDRRSQAVKDSVDASCLKLKQEVSTLESDDKAKLKSEKTQLTAIKGEVTSLKADINNKEKTGKRCELFMSITTAEEMTTTDRVSRILKTDVTEYNFEASTNLLDILRDQSLGHIKKTSIKSYDYVCEDQTDDDDSEYSSVDEMELYTISPREEQELYKKSPPLQNVAATTKRIKHKGTKIGTWQEDYSIRQPGIQNVAQTDNKESDVDYCERRMETEMFAQKIGTWQEDYSIRQPGIQNVAQTENKGSLQNVASSTMQTENKRSVKKK